MSKNENMVCKNCGSLGKAKTVVPGTFGIELLVWIVAGALAVKFNGFLFVAGPTYTLWRLANKFPGCATCGSKDVVPAGSPVGKQIIETTTEKV